MTTSSPPRRPALPGLAGLTAAARQWSVESQQVARRNAMIAATACAQRRAEREDVEDFLRERYRPAAPGGPAVRRALG